jgi:PTH1 family peptidyl-tRNA hydrolase
MIVGLGNPGAKYERNRHNIGFRVVDELARRHGFGALRSLNLGGSQHGATGFVESAGSRHKVLLLKPMEFMNLSGFAVQRAAKFHDVEVEKIVVIHDEIDLDFARLRVKTGGGHGGHNGLRSIVEQLGSTDFQRVRVGVGKPPGAPAGSKNVAGHVLADFPAADAAPLEALIGQAADAAEAILGKGMTAAMNEFNGKPERPGAAAGPT